MNNEDEIELYRYGLFKKLIDMQQAERAVFLMEIFGRRWDEIYARLAMFYPSLLDAPNPKGETCEISLPPVDYAKGI